MLVCEHQIIINFFLKDKIYETERFKLTILCYAVYHSNHYTVHLSTSFKRNRLYEYTLDLYGPSNYLIIQHIKKTLFQKLLKHFYHHEAIQFDLITQESYSWPLAVDNPGETNKSLYKKNLVVNMSCLRYLSQDSNSVLEVYHIK